MPWTASCATTSGVEHPHDESVEAEAAAVDPEPQPHELPPEPEPEEITGRDRETVDLPVG